MNNNT